MADSKGDLGYGKMNDLPMNFTLEYLLLEHFLGDGDKSADFR